ncbi:MAG: hypothetical protein WD990_11675 [Acidimicrobiia bacterium]
MTSSILTRTLALNAGFSGFSGGLLLGAASSLAPWLGTPVWLTRGLGIGLVVFAIAVTLIGRRPRRSLVRFVIAADAVWALGATVVILGFPHAMTAAGLWALGIVSLAVADFAVFQMIGLRRSSLPA